MLVVALSDSTLELSRALRVGDLLWWDWRVISLMAIGFVCVMLVSWEVAYTAGAVSKMLGNSRRGRNLRANWNRFRHMVPPNLVMLSAVWWIVAALLPGFPWQPSAVCFCAGPVALMTLSPLKDQLKCLGRNESIKESHRGGNGRLRSAWSIANVTAFFRRTPPATLTPWHAELGSSAACDRSCGSRPEELVLETEPSDEIESNSDCSCTSDRESILELCCQRTVVCSTLRIGCEANSSEDLSSLLRQGPVSPRLARMPQEGWGDGGL